MVIIVSRSDDNLIIGNPEAVTITEEQLTSRFEHEECGEMNEYVGCKIARPDKNHSSLLSLYFFRILKMSLIFQNGQPLHHPESRMH